MGRIFPRLQSVAYLFSKYFDVWKASTFRFVCLSSIFTALAKYHHLNTFRSGGKRGLGEQRSAPMQVGQKARARETPAAKSRRWRRTILRRGGAACDRDGARQLPRTQPARDDARRPPRTPPAHRSGHLPSAALLVLLATAARAWIVAADLHIRPIGIAEHRLVGRRSMQRRWGPTVIVPMRQIVNQGEQEPQHLVHMANVFEAQPPYRQGIERAR